MTVAEHAGVVGGGAVHARFGDGGAAPEVAAADDDGNFDAFVDGRRIWPGEVVQRHGVDAELAARPSGLRRSASPARAGSAAITPPPPALAAQLEAGEAA